MKIRSLIGWMWRQRLLVIALGILAAVLGGGGGLAVGLTLEENNDFCSSCHTQPEYDFVKRSNIKDPHEVSDLATRHIVPVKTQEALKCISCHGGVNLADRVTTALELGALDTIKFVADDFKQPAKLTHPLPNEYCLQCHVKEVEKKGFDNHFHNEMEKPKAPQLNCTSCHVAHSEADELSKFVNRQVAFPLCNECHKVLGGPTNLK